MKRPVIFLFCLYFLTRFFNLLSLPIFNDEAIYLHWGQVMISQPGQAFLSLFDGKPPLVLWLFGLAQKLPLDPLIAGRGVSVIFGALTLLGILRVCRLLGFSQKAQMIAGLLYIINPLTLFFDRLALLDSAVSTIFIWILFFLLRLHLSSGVTSQGKLAIMLGLIQGAGLWIKGTTRFFLFLPFLVPLITLIIHKHFKKAKKEAALFFTSFLVAQILFLPIRFQPLFAAFQKREGDFLLSFPEIFSFTNLSSHLTLLSLTLLIYLAPFILAFAVFGFLKLYQKDQKSTLILTLFFSLPLVFEFFTARYFLSRYYLFTFLPLFVLAAFGLNSVKKKSLFFIISVLPISLSLCLSISIVLAPFKTLQALSFTNTLKSDLYGYVTGWPSGYGIKEAANWLTEEAKKGPTVVLVRADSGNPEDAMFVYLAKNKNIILAQTNRKPTLEELQPFKQLPVYFVSRGPQLLNMQDRLVERAIFKKPTGNEFIGIYQIKL